jgi:hypothetical protein
MLYKLYITETSQRRRQRHIPNKRSMRQVENSFRDVCYPSPHGEGGAAGYVYFVDFFQLALS